MSDIKIGDLVKIRITLNKKYAVKSVDSNYVTIISDFGVPFLFSKTNVEKVKEEEEKETESTIKAGDTVVCVESTAYQQHLTQGKKYVVIDIEYYGELDNKLYFKITRDDGKTGSYAAYRFKKVEEAKDLKSNIQAGDTVVCISQGNNGPGVVTVGKEYKVLDVNNGGIDFVNDKGDADWFGIRNFKLAAPTSQPVAKPTGGLKYDSNKPPVDLVPREAIEAAARAFAFGARKYAAHNFKLGLQYSRLAGAVQRHLIAFMDNESLDPESGLSHLDHAMSALSMLVYMSQNKPEMDDRFNKQTLKLNNEK